MSEKTLSPSASSEETDEQIQGKKLSLFYLICWTRYVFDHILREARSRILILFVTLANCKFQFDNLPNTTSEFSF